MTIRILTGDCRDVMATLEPDSVDACVTDPPYHLTNRTPDVKWCVDCHRVLGGSDGKPAACPRCGGQLENQRSQGQRGFMGKIWDGGDVAFRPETWAAVLRVLKPGGHLLACSGTRTQHRMVCAIEDAGFEIREQVAWVYGSGFPKSLDVSKAIDKAAGAKGMFGDPKSTAHAGWIERGAMRGGKGDDGWQRPWMDDAEAVDNAARKYIAGSPEAAAWQGWGTALKPSWENICLARKPLEKGLTVAQNVLKWGTGALNIDGCRIEAPDGVPDFVRCGGASANVFGDGLNRSNRTGEISISGRWPANLVHDGSDEVLACFPETGPASAGEFRRKASLNVDSTVNVASRKQEAAGFGFGDTGSAARFYYTAKASRSERGDGNDHPTVKPVDLMRWLVRMVTPRGGMVLDPFAGSGTTGIAANIEQMNATLIEMSPEYVAMAEARIRAEAGLFAEVAAE